MGPDITPAEYRALAELRYRIRHFLREGDAKARAVGLEPQQYLMLLAIRGLPEGSEATIQTLAERLVLKHHSAVELIDRLETHGYVRRSRSRDDRLRVLRALRPVIPCALLRAGPQIVRRRELDLLLVERLDVTEQARLRLQLGVLARVDAAKHRLPDRGAGNRRAVPAHQDVTYNKHLGTFCIVWVPLVEIDRSCGGMAVFPRTQGLGELFAWIDKEHGILNTDGSDLLTKRKFNNYTLHLELLLPYRPDARGQGRGNSGVYQVDHYELQVLDSFGLDGKNNECGGFYTKAEPKVNMCLPPLVWQTYDIDFTNAVQENGKKVKNAHATVKHNGVVIHNNIELPGERNTTAAPVKAGPEPGPVYLQNHGNPVRYRNIWVETK